MVGLYYGVRVQANAPTLTEIELQIILLSFYIIVRYALELWSLGSSLFYLNLDAHYCWSILQHNKMKCSCCALA